MRVSRCECGALVYLATNKRTGRTDTTHYYSERVLYRLVTGDGGTPRAVAVHGLYEIHACAGRMRLHGIDNRRDKIGARNRKPIAAHIVRARKRNKDIGKSFE